MDTGGTKRGEVHNPEVEGSIPSLATEEKATILWLLFLYGYNIGTTIPTFAISPFIFSILYIYHSIILIWQ